MGIVSDVNVVLFVGGALAWKEERRFAMDLSTANHASPWEWVAVLLAAYEQNRNGHLGA